MTDTLYPVSPATQARSHIDAATYDTLYQRSIQDPAGFWGEQAAQFLTWDRPWDRVFEQDMRNGRVSWFAGGKLNISV